jgi:hypothetical protein
VSYIKELQGVIWKCMAWHQDTSIASPSKRHLAAKRSGTAQGLSREHRDLRVRCLKKSSKGNDLEKPAAASILNIQMTKCAGTAALRFVDSKASAAGLHRGDILVAINGRPYTGEARAHFIGSASYQS